ncbi:MAG: FAD-binding oxidoreductase [Vicinamibacteria bacterium]
MASTRIGARPPRGELRPPRRLGGDELATRLMDAARTPGGHSPALLLPSTEAEVAWALRESPALLPIGAQSSLTGGATPFGEWLLATAGFDRLELLPAGHARVGAGVSLLQLEQALEPAGLFFPPTPTHKGACLGGAVATNAAGASTFKHGSTRDWVRGLTVVLATGDVLDLERGACRAGGAGLFEIELPSGETLRVPAPRYRMPAVPKRSAGYHSEPDLDLVDLFVGSEGTLGVVVEAEIALATRPARLAGLLGARSEARALELVARLRDEGRRAHAGGGRDGLDVASVESLDRRCLELLREDAAAPAALIDAGMDTALLFELELAGPQEADAALERLAAVLDDAASGLLVAPPGDRARREALEALREAAPVAVNHRIERAQRELDPLVRKVAADMIVPFERLGEALALYRDCFARRGLDHALFGHVSDGNVHANALPRSRDDVARGDQALREMGEQVIRWGGCPMSEHGVGRNRVKQGLLRSLYGEAGIAQMRAVKAALDPRGRLSPGVLLPPA